MTAPRTPVMDNRVLPIRPAGESGRPQRAEVPT